MLTRGRAQQLVLQAAEPEGLEAYRFLFRQHEPMSTVTTVSKLVDLLATTFSGDLMDSLTDFERRVSSWEHDGPRKAGLRAMSRRCDTALRWMVTPS